MLHLRTRHRHRIRALSLLGFAVALLLAWYQAHPATVPLALNPASPPPTIITTSPTPAPSVLDAATNAAQQAQPGLVRVTHDVDGDTIGVEVNGKPETVRFLGIDTPETHDPRKPVQCFGEIAADHTRSLLEGKLVRLVADPMNSDRDKYQRLLRYVYLPDGTSVNAELIKDGYAFAYTVYPLEKLDEYRALEAQARAANLGLWANCKVDESQTIKQTAGSK